MAEQQGAVLGSFRPMPRAGKPGALVPAVLERGAARHHGGVRHAEIAPSHPAIAADEDRAEMANIMREITRALDADDVLVAWHDGASEPIFFFADGSTEPRSPAERDMLAMAGSLPPGKAEPAWRAFDDGAAGELLTTSIAGSGGVMTITTLFRRIGTSTRLRARKAALRLMPLVAPFFRVWIQRLRTLSRVRGLTAAVNNADMSILLVDRQGQLVFANDAATDLIEQGSGLRLHGTMLSGISLADTMRLRASIEHVVAMAHDTGLGPPETPVVALHRKSGRPLMAAIVPLDPAVDAAGESAAIIYVVDPDQNRPHLLEPACKLYGLSPVEAKLTCLLADGASLTDAADRMRVREQTARSYLKQVFLKTDTNRQAELVWLMLKSAVRTAPACRTSFV